MKKYFLNKNSQPSTTSSSVAIDSGLRNKSLFNPLNRANHQVETFKSLIIRDLEHLTPKKNINPQHIMDGITSLEKRKDIIIRPADKGGGVVILKKDFYLNQLQEMLEDSDTYNKLEKDPSNQYEENLKCLVEMGYRKGVLTSREKKYLVPSSNRTPTIYTLPKIHKDTLNPPGRPIVNGIGSITSRLGEYLDVFLQQSVVNTKAYLKDTKSLLQYLQCIDLTGKEEVYLVTADVSSLYTIIQHEDALLALNWALCKREDLPFNQKMFIRNALDFCLNHNFFWFNGTYYSQCRGVAMGAKFAPSIANLFMGEWEDKTIYAKLRPRLLFYKRYIDDLFFIWDGPLDTLQAFLDELNKNNNNIKLTSEYSSMNIHFLDVEIFRVGNGLGTKVHFKPTDSNSYLPTCSGHHPMWLKNIPKGQLTRVKRNCSELEDFLTQSQVIKNKFIEKGYRADTLDALILDLANTPRDNFMCNGAKVDITGSREWNFLSDFHSQYREVENIFSTHWHVLSMDKTLAPILPSKPGFIYRRASNIADRVVRKVLDPPSRPATFWDRDGFFACKKCRACKEASRPVGAVANFISTSNHKEFTIKEFITCNSDHVVYALQCPCGLIYIGRTKRQMKIRIAEHVVNILNGYKDHNVSLHFKLFHSKDPRGLKFWGIDHLKPEWRGSNLVRDLSKRETQWIFSVDTLSPRGLNVDLDINCFISDF